MSGMTDARRLHDDLVQQEDVGFLASIALPTMQDDG
jgi:hypothetical protein